MRKDYASAQAALHHRQRRLPHVSEQLELLHDNLGAIADGIDGADGAVGPDLHLQTVVVGIPTDARAANLIVNLAHRREHGVHWNHAQGQAIGLASGHVAAAGLNV